MSGDDRAAVRADRIEALLEAILGQLRLLTAAHGPRDECERALEAAIAEEFSPSPFTLRMLLEVEKGDPRWPARARTRRNG
jgi:hypothetical protein